ncbi:hypothetical protein, partial [Xanthomonas campestris]|uniref:hypothetical protein n=1 Tax=Xanthomonas campestris TaxID=339 RepID=UPI0039C44A7A
PASACLMNPMICSVLKRLFFMSVLVVDGLYSFTWYGSAGAGQAIRNCRELAIWIVSRHYKHALLVYSLYFKGERIPFGFGPISDAGIFTGRACGILSAN